jgi:SAM-dependent methyltransferase
VLTNQRTADLLDRVGVDRGWRCLEVGAGDGIVAQWLAGRVGPEGRVVATDIDPRFLAGLAGVEVRRHDVLCDPLECGAYDLVHCRALLMHLRDPGRALARMVAALRPGGWLVIEEGDLEPVTVVGPTSDVTAKAAEVHRAVSTAVQRWGGIDVHLGRRCRALLERLGFVDVGEERTSWSCRGGDAAARFHRMSVRLLVEHTGLISAADHEALQCLYDDPSFSFAPMPMVGAWGRRPAEAS